MFRFDQSSELLLRDMQITREEGMNSWESNLHFTVGLTSNEVSNRLNGGKCCATNNSEFGHNVNDVELRLSDTNISTFVCLMQTI